MFLLRMFGISFLLTVAVEEAGALAWGIRKVRDLLTILWINAVTNPAIVALRYLSNQTISSQTCRTLILLMLEVLVVLSEWLLFRHFLIRNRHSFLMSVTLNAASYGAGLLFPVILGFVLRHF